MVMGVRLLAHSSLPSPRCPLAFGNNAMSPAPRPNRFSAWVYLSVTLLLDFGSTATSRSADLPPERLKVGVVQMALGRTLADNRDRIVNGISKAADRGVRVVVLPKAARRGQVRDNPAAIQEAIERIRQTARMHGVYVLFGGASHSSAAKNEQNWIQVVGPDGRDLYRYDKIYDQHRAKMPGIFEIDGIPCNAFL